LGIPEDKYTVCFQSRLGRGWIEPFSDEVIEELGKKGAKKLLVFSPAFVADCLETTIEIGEEYQELFEEHGGEHVQLVPSLNESKTWIDCLEDLVK
jgi:ferrochelatase